MSSILIPRKLSGDQNILSDGKMNFTSLKNDFRYTKQTMEFKNFNDN